MRARIVLLAARPGRRHDGGMKNLAPLLSGLLLCSNAFAASPTVPTDLRDSDAIFEQFKSRQQVDYTAINARYRDAVAAAPGDVELAVAQCRFIENFHYAEDIDWSDAASEDLAACRDSLVARAGQAPEVRVYRLEYLPYSEASKLEEATWKAAKAWPPALRARVATRLSAIYEESDAGKAGDYAVHAARLGNADLLEDAIAHLADRGEREQAIALAAASPLATSPWHVARRVDALIALGDAAAARRELDHSLRAGLDVATTARINVYLAGKDLASANAAARDLGSATTAGIEAARFRLALANGELAKARGMVDFDSADNAWLERYSEVVARAPGHAFLSPLLPFTLTILMIVLMTAALPGLLLVPVHYRGLVRRLKGRAPLPMFERIGLRHAWLAGSLVIIVPTLVLFAMRPDAIAPLFNGGQTTADSDFAVAAIGSLLTLLCLAPWLPRIRNSWYDERNALRLRVALTVTACWLGVFAVGLLSHWFHQAFIGGDSSTEQTRAVEALMRAGTSDFGLLGTWLMLGVLTPVVEEVAFRGMLLGGIARHISFGWANTMQGLLFAAVHADPPRFLFYFALGTSAGWLARRYRSLLPAIALHALNNTFVTLVR